MTAAEAPPITTQDQADTANLIDIALAKLRSITDANLSPRNQGHLDESLTALSTAFWRIRGQ